jgi:hypothetical protein
MSKKTYQVEAMLIVTVLASRLNAKTVGNNARIPGNPAGTVSQYAVRVLALAP